MSDQVSHPSLLACLRADARFLTRTQRSRAKKWASALMNRGMQVMVLYRLSHALWRRRVPLLPLLFTRLCQHLYAVDISYEAQLGPGIVIVHGFGLVIGRETRVEGQCMIFHGVTFGDRGSEWIAADITDGHPTVGWGCVFGAGAKILGPIQVGGNSVVGANSVVLKNVPANSIVAGVPGRVIGQRPAMDAQLRPLNRLATRTLEQPAQPPV